MFICKLCVLLFSNNIFRKENTLYLQTVLVVSVFLHNEIVPITLSSEKHNFLGLFFIVHKVCFGKFLNFVA